MIVAIRFLIPLLIILTVIYVGLSIYSRLIRRRKLIAHWEKKGMTGDRDAFVARGLKKYDSSFPQETAAGRLCRPAWGNCPADLYYQFQMRAG